MKPAEPRRILVATDFSAFSRPATDYAISHANSGRYDLVVVGTHGRGGLRHLVIGSVAEQVVRRSAIPVVTVRPDSQKR